MDIRLLTWDRQRRKSTNSTVREIWFWAIHCTKSSGFSYRQHREIGAAWRHCKLNLLSLYCIHESKISERNHCSSITELENIRGMTQTCIWTSSVLVLLQEQIRRREQQRKQFRNSNIESWNRLCKAVTLRRFGEVWNLKSMLKV